MLRIVQIGVALIVAALIVFEVQPFERLEMGSAKLAAVNATMGSN